MKGRSVGLLCLLGTVEEGQHGIFFISVMDKSFVEYFEILEDVFVV